MPALSAGEVNPPYKKFNILKAPRYPQLFIKALLADDALHGAPKLCVG